MLVLLVGHGLNIVMSILSVVVHGIRLNVLEFSSQLGMDWSGYKYEPFREEMPKINEREIQ
jgi:V/A-type H+-transporting ATPase subunit I